MRLASRCWTLLCGLSVALASTLAAAQTPRTIYDILAQFDQFKPDPELRRTRLAQVAAEPPNTNDNAALARFYHQRSRTAQELGLVHQRVADLEMALPHAVKAGLKSGGEGGDVARIQSDLASAWNALDYRKSISYAEAIIARNKTGWPAFSQTTRIAEAFIHLGDLDSAETTLKRADALFEQVRARSKTDEGELNHRAHLDGSWAYYLRARGKLDQAEVRYRAAIDAASGALQVRDLRVAANRRSRTEESILHRYDADVRGLADSLRGMGRFEEAEVLLRDLLKTTLVRVGGDTRDASDQLRALSLVMQDQGRAQESLALAQRAVRINAEIGLPNASFSALNTRRELATRLAEVGRFGEAVAAFQALREDTAADPRLTMSFAGPNRAWAYSLSQSGRTDEAVTMLRQCVVISERTLGSRSFDAALNRGFLGVVLAGQGKREDALAEFRAATETLVTLEGYRLEYVRRSLQASRDLSLIAGAYIDLLHEIGGTPLERRSGLDTAAESLRLSELLRGSKIQRAVTAAAARTVAGSPELASLVRQQQDLGHEEEALYRILLEQMSALPEQQSLDAMATLRKRANEVASQRSSIGQEIERRFPKYANLVNPRLPTVEQARTSLRPGEAMLSLLPTSKGTFIWALPHTGSLLFRKAALREEQVSERVARLRSAVESTGGRISKVSPFDVGLAYELYDSFVKPVEAALTGSRTVYFVTSGSLAQLPPAVLVMAPPAAPAGVGPLGHDYDQVEWLARRFATAQLPSINALISLRASPTATGASQAFTGFGDPQFARSPGSSRGQSVRNLDLVRVTEQQTESGKDLAWTPYSRLPPLPDTREEILALAAMLNADASRDVFLGAAATKKAVSAGGVGDSRIVAFATHGLLPGDFPGLVQPALALSAPEGVNVDLDPSAALLTMEDVLRLKLNAEWIVLSACNTASGDGTGAEAISGLGRAFFYAGSRALLVTHWPVETVSARLLVTKTFERYVADPGLPRAEALRRATLEVMKTRVPGGSGTAATPYAHPLYWAPYTLVGDAGR